MYSAYRYLAPLELLAPLVFGLAIARMQLSRKTLWLVLTIVGLLSVLVLDVPNRKRYDWDERYIDVTIDEMGKPEETLVLMVGGGAPMSYVIPEFPAGVRFLRPDSNLGLRKNHLMMKKITNTVRGHSGPIYLLFAAAQKENALRSSLEKFELTAPADKCRELQTNTPDHLFLCLAERGRGNDA